MEEKYAVQAVQEAIAKLDEMTAEDAASERFTRWQVHATRSLIALLGEEALAITQFRHIVYRTHKTVDGKAAAERLWQSGKELARQILQDALAAVEGSKTRTTQPASEVLIAKV